MWAESLRQLSVRSDMKQGRWGCRASLMTEISLEDLSVRNQSLSPAQ